MNRRTMLTQVLAAAAASRFGSVAVAARQSPATGAAAAQDLKPAKLADPEPQVNDIEKYPRCAYCNMDRRRFHFSRMLIPYADGTVDGLCSIRCAMTSLTVNMSKGPLAVWVGDNASPDDPKPLIDALTATYLVGSTLPSVMSKRSKTAFSTAQAADAAKSANGGEVMAFDKALAAAYLDVAESVAANLMRRREAATGSGAGRRQ